MISIQHPAEIASHDNTPWWGRIGLLWLMFVPLCAALYTLCLSIGPNDFWYHARAGGVLATSGQLPRTNLFSDGVPLDTPYFYQSWIAEWAFYKLLEGGGLSAIVLARAFCITLACAVVTLAAFRRAHHVQSTLYRAQSTVSARVAATAALAGFLMASNNVDTRPQMFSIPLFALWIFALCEWPHVQPRRRIWLALALGALMALWVNLHGAFFTGIIVLGAALCGEALHLALPRRFDGFCGAPSSLRALSVLAMTLGFALLAACCNPRGIDIYNYVFSLASNGASQKYIQEWQSPDFSLAEWTSLVFAAAPFALALMAWRCARRRQSTLSATDKAEILGACGWRVSEMLVLSALFVMALRDKRAIIWFAFAFVPIIAGALSALLARRTQSTLCDTKEPRATTADAAVRQSTLSANLLSRHVPSRGAQVMNGLLAVFLLSLVVPVLPYFKPLVLPPSFRARFAPNPRGAFPLGFDRDPPLLLDRTTPVEAASWLRAHPPRGKLFHDMVFGSYLMWALQNQTRPFCDPRIELYPDAFWDEYARWCAGPPDAARILQRHGFSDALLDPKLQSGLLRRLRQSPDWKIVALRGPAVLLRRR